MYYAANAVLYRIGYKVGRKVSHKVTADALIVLARNKLMKSLLEDYEDALSQTNEILASLDKEREKRSVFQYETTEDVKKAKASTSLERAKLFVFEMEKLL